MSLPLRLGAVLPPLCFCLALAGCASKAPAPEVAAGTPRVVEGAPPPPPAEPAPASVAKQPGANEYVVKKGDTLYAIALDHGVDYKDLARWNGIANVNLIRVGQVLTLAEPGLVEAAPSDGVTVKPVVAAAPAPIALEAPAASASQSSAPPAEAAANTAEVKRGPKGGKVPYSESALAQARAREGATPVTTGAAPPTSSAPSPAPAPVAGTVAVGTAASAAVPAGTPEPAPAASAPPASESSSLAWSWPGAGKVLAGFVEGGNKGVDIGGKVGDPVLAAAPGKVSYVGSSLRGYGKMIVVKHNAEFLSVYAHNSKVLVAEGQAVTAGQKIAELGDTDTDAPKLHFEIRRQGKPVNPAGFLPAR